MTAATASLADECLDYIRAEGTVTFHALCGWLSRHGVDPYGDGDGQLEAGENVILWTGISEAFVEFAIRIRDRTEPAECGPEAALAYLWEGAPIPALPQATGHGLKHGYKTPHWAPMTLRLREAAA